MAIPTKDEVLVPYFTNWNNRLGVGATNFGLTVEQAAEFSARFTPYQTAFTSVSNAREAGTRSKALTATKSTAKAHLLAYARVLYATLQANTAVTDANKALLGVEVRRYQPKPIPAPTVRPTVAMVSAIARTVTVDVYDPNGKTRRSKLPTAICANVYTYVGDASPSDPTLWQLAGAATKSKFTINFPNSVPSGANVFICAAWMTRRSEVGPPSVPISTNVQGGGANEASVGMNTPSVKLAA